MLLVNVIICISWSSICYGEVPSVQLHNAADDDVLMPVVGLGTFGYSRSSQDEKWNYTTGFNTALQWFSVGGRRWDSAHQYKSKQGVADGLLNVTNNYTTTPRSDIFITNKIGSGQPAMGYNDTLQQFEDLIKIFQTSYMDLLLIHWPSYSNTSLQNTSSDPTCNNGDPSHYNPTICRQNTWRAMETIYNGYTMDTGLKVRSRAIGVSNFEQKHLEDIFNLNSMLPSVNQFEFHGYWHEFSLVEYCQSYNILVNSYSPLGAPDVEAGNWKPILTEHPVAINIGKTYNKSAAQVWLRWQWNQRVVINPRTENITHMREILDIFDFQLNQNEMLQLSSVTPPTYPNNKVNRDPSTLP